MKVLLTGATGTVGRHIIPLLLEKNYELTVLELKTKKTKKILKKYDQKIKIIYGDITNKKLVARIVKENDVVIHLASLIPPFSENDHNLTKRVNYEGTKNIVFAIQEAKRGFLLFASSISVYGDRLKNYKIKVTDPVVEDDKDYYAYIKIQTEKLIKESGIDFSIFRLTAVMNEPKLNPLMFKMPLETKLEIVTAKDAARAFVNSLEHLEKLNQNTFNLGGGINCRTTYQKFLKACFKIFGLNYNHLKEEDFEKSGFHCGYYVDGHELNQILNFRNDTLLSYYAYLENRANSLKKILTRVFSFFIIKRLQNSIN